MAKKEVAQEEVKDVQETKPKKERKFKKSVGNFFSDFKKFISKGNIIDLAVGVAMGTAFNAIVNALVKNVIMPFVSFLCGGKSVADWKWVIKEATYDELGNVVTAETALTYGVFIQAIIDFLIIAMTLFIVLRVIVNSQRGIKRLSRKERKALKEQQEAKPEEAPAPAPVKIESQEDILRDIRTLLQGKPLESDEEEVVEEKEDKKEDKKETK